MARSVKKRFLASGFMMMTLWALTNPGCKSNSGGNGGGGDPAPTQVVLPVATQPGITIGTGPTSIPLPTASTTGGVVDFTYILADDIKAQCVSQGKMVDRPGRKCLDATLDASKPCDAGGIAASFGGSAQAVTQALNDLQGQGFQIDQCGSFNGKAYVSLYKTFVDNGLARIQSKYLAPQ